MLFSRCLFALLFVLVCAASSMAPAPLALAELKLPAVFTDHGVLQRGMPIRVWGWASPGSEVSVELGNLKPWNDAQPAMPPSVRATTTTGKDGKFTVMLPTVDAAGSGTLTVTSGTDSLTRQNILLGEVWFCSGQSNMQWPVNLSSDPEATINAADYPNLRLFQGPQVTSETPMQDTEGAWTICTPETIPGFSAVAYHFGLGLQQELDVPVGLIHSSWGGTPADAWTRWQSIERNPITQPIITRPLKDREHEDPRPTMHPEPAFTADDLQYTKPDFDDSQWETITLPASIEDIKADLDGVVWFRTTVKLPDSWQNKELQLHLGAIDDADITFVNGEEVGRIGTDVSNHWTKRREYTVPAALPGEGELTIAVRLFDQLMGGGFAGADEHFALINGDERISLAKPWRCFPQHERWPNQLRQLGHPQYQASTLYHAMVLPYAGYGIRGAIWYQGESNAWRARQYHTLLPMMIRDWKQAWNLPTGHYDFAFGIVELASFKPPKEQPGNDDWAELREAQRMSAAQTPNAGTVSAMDLGNANDIHPRNKRAVGKRLSDWALATQYGQTDRVHQGPVITSSQFKDRKAIVTIQSNGKDQAIQWPAQLGGFALAGEDKQWRWATAKAIDGNTLEITSDEISEPVAVRYAWEINPYDGPNGARIANDAGLPMTPYRSDDWPYFAEHTR